MAFCNKCGFLGDAESGGSHTAPIGTPCIHTASLAYYTQWCDRIRRTLVDTVWLNLNALGPRDPNELMNDLLRTASHDVVIEVLQTAIERGRISLDNQGFVINIPKNELGI